MNRLLVVMLVAALLLPVLAVADTVTLTSPEQRTLPAATKLDWKISNIDAGSKKVIVKYRYLAADGTPVQGALEDSWETWTCSGACFDAVFGFTIRPQDAGTKIGAGLRTLIWNRFRNNVLSPGNSGTFAEE